MAKADFDKLLGQLTSVYGTTTVVRASDSAVLAKTGRVETGILALDIILGGGVPVDRMLVMKGEYSTGKTALALKMTAAFQRRCRNCGRAMVEWDEINMAGKPVICCTKPEPSRIVWADAEHCWDNGWATLLGVDTKNIYVVRAESAEQTIDVCDAMIRSGEVDLLVVDSVAALTPSVEIEESVEKQQMGVHARLMNKAMRKWTSASQKDSLSRKFGCTIILINQMRQKIGVIYGSPKTSPGGKGIEFQASVVLEMKNGKHFEYKGMPAGLEMGATAVKNKTAPPHRSAELNLAFVDHNGRVAGSTDVARQVFRFARFWGLIVEKGSWYTLAKDVQFQGEEKAVEFLSSPQGALVYKMLRRMVLEKETVWLSGDKQATATLLQGGTKAKE